MDVGRPRVCLRWREKSFSLWRLSSSSIQLAAAQGWERTRTYLYEDSSAAHYVLSTQPVEGDERLKVYTTRRVPSRTEVDDEPSDLKHDESFGDDVAFTGVVDFALG